MGQKLLKGKENDGSCKEKKGRKIERNKGKQNERGQKNNEWKLKEIQGERREKK